MASAPSVDTHGRGRAESVGILTLVIMGTLSAVSPMSTDMYLPSFPRIEEELEVSKAAVQLTLSACLWGVALGQLLGGPVSDALGRRRPLLIGVWAYVAMSVACAVAPTIGLLTGARFLQGLGGGVGIVIARAMVRDKTEGHEAARLFTRLTVISGAAPVLAPIMGGILDDIMPWRGIFLVLAGMGVAMGLGVVLHLPESLPPELRRTGGFRDAATTFHRVLKDRVFLGYAIGQSFVFATLFLYISSSSFVLQETYGVSAQRYSLLFALNSVGIWLMARLNGLLLRHHPPERILPWGLGQCLLGALLVPLSVQLDLGLAGLLPALFLVVSSMGLNGANAQALALAPYGRSAGSVAAQMGVMQFTVAAASGPVFGAIADVTPMTMGVAMVLTASTAMASYVFLVRRAPARVVAPAPVPAD